MGSAYMNTPKTPKPLVRHDPMRHVAARIHYGHFTLGVENPTIAEWLGRVITFWPNVEESVVGILDVLMDDHSPTPRHIFRALINQKARIEIMRRLLKDSAKCVALGREFDDAIDEFEALNRLRNAYAHGLWKTQDNTKEVYLATSMEGDDPAFAADRTVTKDELEEAFSRMEALHALAFRLKAGQLAPGPVKPSRRKRPSPSGGSGT